MDWKKFVGGADREAALAQSKFAASITRNKAKLHDVADTQAREKASYNLLRTVFTDALQADIYERLVDLGHNPNKSPYKAMFDSMPDEPRRIEASPGEGTLAIRIPDGLGPILGLGADDSKGGSDYKRDLIWDGAVIENTYVDSSSGGTYIVLHREQKGDHLTTDIHSTVEKFNRLIKNPQNRIGEKAVKEIQRALDASKGVVATP